MANKAEEPFNLLLKFDAQKTSIDKIYDFVLFQGRIIVVCVMLVIIVAFVIRFPLDKTLHDQQNIAKENVSSAEFYLKKNEQEIRNIQKRIQAASIAEKIYPESLKLDSTDSGQIRFGQLLKRITSISSPYASDFVITSYSYSTDPLKGSILRLAGSVSDSLKAEAVREGLVKEKELVQEVTLTNFASTQGTSPRFNIDIKIRNKIVK